MNGGQEDHRLGGQRGQPGDERAQRGATGEQHGGGGGQPFLATAGGKNPDGIQAAIDKAVELIVEQVK